MTPTDDASLGLDYLRNQIIGVDARIEILGNADPALRVGIVSFNIRDCLLGIDEHKAEEYRSWINRGYHGIKPGWCRVGFHYVFDEAEVDYLISCVEFVAEHGHRFVKEYHFDARDGRWQHRAWQEPAIKYSLQHALDGVDESPEVLNPQARRCLHRDYLQQAEQHARRLT